MQDAFAYCAELVRAADRDRYLASLFAPAERRGSLHALYAFDSEVARVHEVARQPLAGEIRLRWWSEVVAGERSGEAAGNPIARALLATIDRHRLDAAKLVELIEARQFDLYDEPMAGLSELETYVRRTSSPIFSLGAKILADTEAEAAAAPAGIAYGIVGLLSAFPRHAARRQLTIPRELLERHDVQSVDLFANRSSPGLVAAVADLGSVARRHLAAAREHLVALPAAALPAFLPLALMGPSLDRLARSSPFAPSEIPAWRRQWLIWRAARNPARIAG